MRIGCLSRGPSWLVSNYTNVAADSGFAESAKKETLSAPDPKAGETGYPLPGSDPKAVAESSPYEPPPSYI